MYCMAGKQILLSKSNLGRVVNVFKLIIGDCEFGFEYSKVDINKQMESLRKILGLDDGTQYLAILDFTKTMLISKLVVSHKYDFYELREVLKKKK